jgi:hypothetical protein
MDLADDNAQDAVALRSQVLHDVASDHGPELARDRDFVRTFLLVVPQQTRLLTLRGRIAIVAGAVDAVMSGAEPAGVAVASRTNN